jgi:predicted permease
MLTDFFYRLRTLLRRKSAEDELQEELQYHLEREAAKYSAAGASPSEARRRARIAFGGLELVRQQCRDARNMKLLEDLMQDLRYGLRTLGKSPGFTVVTILTLAVGIGACTAIFSIVNAVLLRALPYKDPARLVRLYTPNPHFKLPVEEFDPSYADFFDLQRQSRSFSSMTLFQNRTYSLASKDGTNRVGGVMIDSNFFPTLGSQPEIGRGIESQDMLPGQENVAVISHALWAQMFAGDAEILAKSLRLDGRAYQIIGVMPAAFGYPHDTDLYESSHGPVTQVWIPLVLSPGQKADRDDGDGHVLARLRNGVTGIQAQMEMRGIMSRLDRLHDPRMRGFGAFVQAFRESALGRVPSLMWLLLGAVSLVLLIACGNAASLLLARSASRGHELGIRATLGAGRNRVIRQILTESLLLGLVSGVVGTIMAYVLLHALLRFDPGNIPRLREAAVDSRVLLFTVAVSLLTSVLFGILPAVSASRINLIEFLKSGGKGSTAGAGDGLRSCLIVAEVALAVVLLAGAGLLLRSYAKIESVDAGFSQSTVSMNIQLDARYRNAQQGRAFFQNLLGKLAAIPGVQAVGGVDDIPLSDHENLTMFWVDGYANQEGQLVEIRNSTPHYFAAMGTPILEGRTFTENELSGGAAVVVINQVFARNYFQGRDPIGQRVRTRLPDAQWKTVVGVVRDIRHSSLEEAAGPQVFEPFWQTDAAYIAIRSVLPAKEIASTVRSTLHSIDPDLAVADLHTMGELVSQANGRRLFQTTLLSIYAAIALLLALVGFYGLLAYSVKQRTPEIGVRIALGASRGRVLSMVLRQGLQLTIVGLLLGLAGALALTRVLSSSLYGVSALDPITFMGVPVLLLLVTIAACLIPARRAACIDPMRGLRYE